MGRTKYILVEREDFHPTAVSPVVLAQMLADGVVLSSRPVTQREIKTDRISVYADADYFRHRDQDRFRDRYHGKTVAARVRWFAMLSGEGVVEFDDQTLPVYACNIAGRKTLFAETACVYYEAGQFVDVTIETQFGGRVFVHGLTPGHFDQAKWDRIKDTDLAFRCDDKGDT